MPLSAFQKRVLVLLASNRSQESYIAGGVPIADFTDRNTGDADIFHDPAVDVAGIAASDVEQLRSAGLDVSWERRHATHLSATVGDGMDRLKLEWASDTPFRFYPARVHPSYGFVLHPADLAVNKVCALAGRNEARDVHDIIALSRFVPIPAAILATPGVDVGYTPERLVDEIRRHLRHPAIAFEELDAEKPIDGAGLIQELRAQLVEAEVLFGSLGSGAAGRFYLEKGRIVVPDPARLTTYGIRNPSAGGTLPQNDGLEMDQLAQVLGGGRDGR